MIFSIPLVNHSILVVDKEEYSLFIILVWVSIAHTAVLANEIKDENSSNLVLSLDCKGTTTLLFFSCIDRLI